MEKCSAIWVVGGITRAIHDKAAQKLLGQSFKQQLNFDGNYSRVTFICSKTDEISVTEAAEFLGLDNEVEALRHRESALEEWEEVNKKQLQNDEAREKSLDSYITELGRRERQWSKIKTQKKKGETVTTSLISSKKRKAVTSASRASKRRKTSSSAIEGQDMAYTSANDLWDCLENDMPKFPDGAPLSEEQIRSVMDYLGTKRDMALDEKEGLREKIENANDTRDDLECRVEEANAHLLSSCIQKRNEHARDAIRKDFAQGLRE